MARRTPDRRRPRASARQPHATPQHPPTVRRHAAAPCGTERRITRLQNAISDSAAEDKKASRSPPPLPSLPLTATRLPPGHYCHYLAICCHPRCRRRRSARCRRATKDATPRDVTFYHADALTSRDDVPLRPPFAAPPSIPRADCRHHEKSRKNIFDAVKKKIAAMRRHITPVRRHAEPPTTPCPGPTPIADGLLLMSLLSSAVRRCRRPFTPR